MSIILYGESIISNIHQPVILLLFSHLVMSNSLWPHGLQHSRFPYPSQSPRACSNSCPLSRWWVPTISSSAVPFTFCLQSFPASGSFLMSQISLQSKGLSRVFSNTTVQKHQFFSTQPSSQSNSHIHTWPLEKPQPWRDEPLLASNVSAFQYTI